MGERRAAGTDRREPSTGLVLAAVERAARHRLPEPGPAPVWAVLEHLAIGRRSGAARDVGRRLEELELGGLLASGREHGVTVWSLTRAGREALARGAGEQLPESPRRRAWRNARAAAAQELPRFRARLAAALAETERMLALTEQAPGPGPRGARPGGAGAPTAHEWLRAGRALAGDCSRLASAWHCLHEWEEPADDDRAAETLETVRRAELAALRNVRLWREGD